MTGAELGTEPLDRMLSIEIARVTERAAVAAATLRGRGDEKAADQAAVEAMRAELNRVAIDGLVVVGEGERDEVPMLYVGEVVGNGTGPQVDIALDPLEGTTICAKNLPNSLAVIAVAARGSLFNVPDVYMEKIAIGPGYPDGLVSLRRSATENLEALADAKGVPVSEISACILDRPRHAQLIEEVRATGASIRLIGDGDVAGVIHAADPDETGIDIYMGIGGAPEGVLAAAALRCTGGQMEGRLQLNTAEKRQRAEAMGITDASRIYRHDEMASGHVIFAATGVTDGNILDGVRLYKNRIETHTLVMRSFSHTVREIRARHYDRSKFGI
ncbi:class II fructose-bisphosphatase [Mangrovibrevibacter kandeliae]|uniref:class II fructose-bisphosphatase n=1 Tax=Mangrovibrevibacter kandeliae TaxID=2968473 RepID=UPI002119AC10|nr:MULTISPECIES: class II fructose-bisphosphatase [unclassified Aurantimonas]MCQ8782730.1 class II fructose-bisphosphatase [Aurantimonas sp. CSK15Z-1]MCW4114462.1 class II fructose-bisphosphatase [Aurantimonas sp. MSK8Z-1]